jgi:outer membrane protein assembly factor BamE (lipoprotein component of BamABCDE complex)
MRAVELGMTREQVESIMGNPAKINKYVSYGLNMETWYYPQWDAASEPVCCMFDSDANKVVKVVIYSEVKTAESYKKLREESKQAFEDQ